MPYNKYIPSMRRFHWISLGVFTLLAVVPLGVHADTIFNPIVSGECLCPGRAPDWGCVLQTFQAAMNDFVSFAVVIITLFIAQAGFTYMTSPTNPEKKQLANKRLLNAVIGLLIVLCAWLLIDSLMKVIYNQNSGFGPWNSILVSNGSDYCIKQQQAPSAMQALQSLGSPTNAIGGIPPTGTGSCSPASVQSAAAAGGYNISTSEANTLACLAKPESACGNNTSGAKTSAGQSTSASGPWQILVGANDKCHSLNIPACGNLNCSAAYSGGRVKSDSASVSLAQQCQAEANNLNCSAAAASCLIQANGGSYGAWTGTGDGYTHSAQSTCVSQYSGN